jgi:hypothetical protein
MWIKWKIKSKKSHSRNHKYPSDKFLQYQKFSLSVTLTNSMSQQPLLRQGLLNVEAPRSHSDISHSLGSSGRQFGPDVETSTWQYTTIKRDRQPCLRRDSNAKSQQAKRAAADPRLRPCGHLYLNCLRIHAVKNHLYASNMLHKDKGLFQSKVYTQTHFLPLRQPTHSPSHSPIS